MKQEPFDTRVSKAQRIKVLTNLGIPEESTAAVLELISGIAAASYEAGLHHANLTDGTYVVRPRRRDWVTRKMVMDDLTLHEVHDQLSIMLYLKDKGLR